MSTLAGVIGSDVTRTPIAFATAFATAAGVGMIGGSPTPFAPRLFAIGSGLLTASDDDLGDPRGARDRVAVEPQIEHSAAVRIGQVVLPQRHAEPLDHAALDLARVLHGVDEAADVVARHDLPHRYLAGIEVHLDIRDLHPERADRDPVGVRAPKPPAGDREVVHPSGELGDRQPALGRARDKQAPVLEPHVVRRGLEHRRRRIQQMPAGVLGGHPDGGPARRDRLAAGGEGAVGKRRVAEVEDHPLDGEREDLRGDLREGGFRPGADLLRADPDLRAAVGVQPQLRVRGRRAGAAPHLARHAEAAPLAVPGDRPGRGGGAPVPARGLGREFVRLAQKLARVAAALHLIRLRVVLEAQGERVHLERVGERLHGAVERDRALDVPRRPERRRRPRVGEHVVDLGRGCSGTGTVPSSGR